MSIKKNQTNIKYQMNIIVSVIVTTKNEEANIGNCLQSIKAQTYLSRGSGSTLRDPQENIEIIVVDNNSTDKTKEIVEKFKKRFTPLNVQLFNRGPERSAQRNYGIEKSKGKYVMYLDADMILSPTVIERSVEKFQNQNSKSLKFNIHNTKYNDVLVALYIPEIILGNSYWSRVRRFERSFYDGTVIDCVRFIRKDIFDEVRGFDLNMTGPEDWDFDKKVRRMGKTKVIDSYNFEEINDKIGEVTGEENNLIETLLDLSQKPLIYHNEVKFNLIKYLRKKSYYGKSFSTYINKWGKNDPDIKKQFGFWYRYFGIFVENGKLKKIIKHPFIFLGIFVLRFLVGISFAVNGFGK